MKRLRFTGPLVVTVCCFAFRADAARACVTFEALDMESARKMMDVIRQPDRDVLDQIAAFKKMSCSDEPALRSFAIENGLAAKSPIVRSLALAEQIFQRDQIRIDLMPDSTTSDRAKKWATEKGNALVYKIQGASRQANCVSMTSFPKCSDPSNFQKMSIDRDKIRLLDANISGVFALQPDGTLRGTLKPDATIGDVPARILLQ